MRFTKCEFCGRKGVYQPKGLAGFLKRQKYKKCKYCQRRQ